VLLGASGVPRGGVSLLLVRFFAAEGIAASWALPFFAAILPRIIKKDDSLIGTKRL